MPAHLGGLATEFLDRASELDGEWAPRVTEAATRRGAALPRARDTGGISWVSSA